MTEQMGSRDALESTLLWSREPCKIRPGHRRHNAALCTHDDIFRLVYNADSSSVQRYPPFDHTVRTGP